MARAPYKAKAMSPINPFATKNTNKDGVPQQVTGGGSTKPPMKPKPGSNPKASMMDGPYGGKKPQG